MNEISLGYGPALDGTHVWGKLTRDASGAVRDWHPLAHHCADVAACCEALLKHTLVGERFRRRAGLVSLSSSVIARLCICAFLHDLGKINRGFQNKADPHAREKAGHVRELVALFGVIRARQKSDIARKLLDAARLEDVHAFGSADCENGGLTMLWTAVCHHGEPVAAERPNWNLWKHDSIFASAKLLADAAFTMFPEATNEGALPIPTTAEAQHAFAGIVMLADWIGSDTRYFPFSSSKTADRAPFAREAAIHALRATGLLAADARASRDGVPVTMRSLSPYTEARGVQKPVLETAWEARAGSLTLIEAETGAGKTEAALAHFLRLHGEGLVDGMYFALPTRTAAKQLYARVCAAMELAFPAETSRPPVVLAVPGYLSVDGEQGQRLPGFEVLWQENPRLNLRDRGWASEHPKRFLAAAVAVGTIDQALLSTLPVGHAHMRQAALSRQLLVVDEVHASDPYMAKLLEGVLARTRAGGGHALLLSATLGTVAQATYFGDASLPSLAEACALPYPRLRFQAAVDAAVAVKEDAPTPGKSVRISTEPWMEAAERVAERALAAARSGAKVLIIRNTVRSALETQRALEDLRQGEALFAVDDTFTLHHSRFAEKDRGRLDDAIEGALGKNARRGGIVVVGTQTVQQSLDLDADFLITDLCPVDVLLQRIGRLHRHARPASDRPSDFQEPLTLLLVPERPLADLIGSDGVLRGPAGIGTVYEDACVLEATLRQAEGLGTWNIPNQNRSLVERATHPEALEAVAATMGAHGQKHRITVFGGNAAKRSTAAIALLEDDKPYTELTYANREEKITTRLGADDRQLEFPDGIASPFGGRVHRLSVPGWLAKGVPADALPVEIVHEPGVVRFRFGDLHFSYDRHGLARSDRKHATTRPASHPATPLMEELDG